MAAPKQPLAFSLGEEREREHIKRALAFANASTERALHRHWAFLFASNGPQDQVSSFKSFFTGEQVKDLLARTDPANYLAAVKWLWEIRDAFREQVAAIATDLNAARRDLENDLNKDLRRVSRNAFLKDGILEESIIEISESVQGSEVNDENTRRRTGKP